MSPTLPTSRERGFTLLEALISTVILVVVMVLSMGLLFSMRSFAERQQLVAEPRQSARRALEYLSYHVRGAADLNSEAGNPNAIVTWYQRNGVPVQSTYNSLDGSEQYNSSIDAETTAFGDVGTDIITVAVPPTTPLIPVDSWPGWQHAANLDFQYADGCPDSALNLQMFKLTTGFDPATGMSGPMVLVGSDGTWAYYQITDYQDGPNANCCTGIPPTIKVINNPGQSWDINPPGGRPNLRDPALSAVQFITFRVKNRALQQLLWVFDPTAADPDAGWVTLLENVEDLQIAYVYNDGTTWNSASQILFTPGQVPPQVGPVGMPQARDVTNLVGLRVTIVTRAPREVPNQVYSRYRRPAVEDRSEGSLDKLYHYRLTAVLMVRNRTLGG